MKHFFFFIKRQYQVEYLSSKVQKVCTDNSFQEQTAQNVVHQKQTHPARALAQQI